MSYALRIVWICSIFDLTLASDEAEKQLASASLLSTLGDEKSLRCSACWTLADKLDQLFDLKTDASSRLVKSWAEMTTSRRVEEVRKVMTKRICPLIGRMNIAQIGTAPNRQMGDLDKLMKRGGTLDNVKTGAEPTKALLGLCEALSHRDDLLSLVKRLELVTQKRKGKKKRRLVDLRMKDEVCDGLLALACPRIRGEKSAPSNANDNDNDDDYATKLTDEL